MEEKEYLVQDDDGCMPESEFTEEMKKALKEYLEENLKEND